MTILTDEEMEELHARHYGKSYLEYNRAVEYAVLEKLYQQLAELKANSQAVLKAQSECWQREVAESHAREVMLRASFDQLLQATEVSNVTTSTIEIVCRRAKILPTDDTALRELIECAGEVMRERCDTAVLYEHGLDCQAEAIRAIPPVTLEDLI